MTRLPRRGLALVAISLLTSAATAYAECAWVLLWALRADAVAGGPESPVSGRRVLDRPADPSRPVLAAVTTFYLATIWSLILS